MTILYHTFAHLSRYRDKINEIVRTETLFNKYIHRIAMAEGFLEYKFVFF